MSGIIIAAIASILLCFADAGKKILSSKFNLEVIVLLMTSFGLISNSIYFLFFGLPEINWQSTFIPLLICGLIGVLGEILILKALKESDFSLSMPLMAFVPIFSGLIGFALFDEIPTFGSSIGALLVVIGAYILGIDSSKINSWLEPLGRIVSHKGARYMIAFAFVCAASCLGQRYGVKHSSTIFFFTLTLVFNWIFFLILVIKNQKNLIPIIAENFKVIALTGVLWAVGVALMFLSYNLTLAIYAGVAMQSGTICSVLLGWLIFKEKAIKQRLCAALLMISGVIIVTLFK